MENNINKHNKERLVEIKSGKTGYGLLIESDGYVSRDLSENNKKIIKEAFESRENGEWYIPKPFVLDVILTKYGIENANKRIYPEEIMKPEIEKYQKLIDQHMALGECYKPDVDVYTKDGWKKMSDIKVDDEIFTFKLDNNGVIKKFEFNQVIVKIEKDYDGDLIVIKSNNANNEHSIDDIVTPNHRYPVFQLNENEYVFVDNIEAHELEKYREYYIPTSHSFVNDNHNDYIKIESLEFDKEYYNGKVMCFEVENHNFYVKSNNKCHWTSNCNHPSASEIDLGRVAINVIECHWEGHTLVGKIEFNITEGFRRYGICSSLGDTAVNLIMNGYKIGVSSRGVGEVTNRLGKSIVSSFDLICWDLVATPSNPGSYVGRREELEQYIESEQKDENKSKLNEKIEKINKLLI